MTDSPERIVSAAVNAGGVIFSAPPPARHHTILHAMDKMGLDAIVLGAPDAQGFLTDRGRFVQRRKAAHLAIMAEQIDEPKWGAELYSEDLW